MSPSAFLNALTPSAWMFAAFPGLGPYIESLHERPYGYSGGVQQGGLAPAVGGDQNGQLGVQIQGQTFEAPEILYGYAFYLHIVFSV